MTATSPPVPAAAAELLGALLTALEPTGTARDARARGALRAAQRALREPGVRDLQAMADELPSMGQAAAQVAQDRALRAVERYYSRHP